MDAKFVDWSRVRENQELEICHLKSYLTFIHETIYSENSFIVCLLAEYMKLCSERAKGLISENEEKPNFQDYACKPNSYS